MTDEAMPSILYPADCGGPHVWERMTPQPQCPCPLCGTAESFLECKNCFVVMYDDVEGFQQAWDEAE